MDVEKKEYATLRDLTHAKESITLAIHDLGRHVDRCFADAKVTAGQALATAIVADNKATSSHKRIDTWQVWAIIALTGTLGAFAAVGWKLWETVQELIRMVEKGI